MDILYLVLEWLLPVLAGVLSILLAALAKKLLEKMNIDSNEKIDRLIDDYVAKGVGVAEVAARKYLVANNTKLPSEAKRAKAVKVVLDELRESGITDVGEQLIVNRIESWLELKGANPGVPSAPLV